MNARDNIKPKTIRLAILLALSDGAITTIDDLQIRMDEPRKKVVDNAVHAANDDLIKRMRDDVTGGPAYQITPKGREFMASFAGEEGIAELKRGESVALGILEEAMPGFTAEVVAQKDAEIARLTSQCDAWRDAIGDISGEDTPQSAAQFINDLKGRVAGVLSDREEKTQREIVCLRAMRDRMTLMLHNSSAYALAFEGPIELLLANILHKAAHQQSPVGYVVKRPGKTLSRFTKADSAQANAMVSARDGKRAQVFALVPAGVAVPGAEWVGA